MGDALVEGRGFGTQLAEAFGGSACVIRQDAGVVAFVAVVFAVILLATALNARDRARRMKAAVAEGSPAGAATVSFVLYVVLSATAFILYARLLRDAC